MAFSKHIIPILLANGQMQMRQKCFKGYLSSQGKTESQYLAIHVVKTEKFHFLILERWASNMDLDGEFDILHFNGKIKGNYRGNQMRTITIILKPMI